MAIETFGWITTALLWLSFFPEKRLTLHIVGFVASLCRLIYIICLYYSSAGHLARPLLASWIVMCCIHLYSIYRFRNTV